jgi:hypothetical protein
MKKCLFTLNINSYEPDITALTFPLMKRYAEKIEADFHVITERKITTTEFAGLEKFQIYELGREMKNDWNIFIDSDALIHPDFFDVTALLHKDTTCAYGTHDFSPVRMRPDKYFWRDGRLIGKGNWFGICSDWCLDYFHPLDDITIEEATNFCYPTHEERTSAKPMSGYNMVEDWLVSRNIARYGLKHTLVTDLLAQRGRNINFIPIKVATPQGMQQAQGTPVFHVYQQSSEQKLVMMQQQLVQWGISIEGDAVKP